MWETYWIMKMVDKEIEEGLERRHRKRRKQKLEDERERERRRDSEIVEGSLQDF